MRLLPILALTVLIGGCGEPTIDGSSDEAFRASIREVSDSLPENRRDSLATAFMKLAMSSMTPAMMMSNPDSTAVLATVRQQVDGMTADQVLEAARNAPAPDFGAMLGAAMGAALLGDAPGASSGTPSAYNDSVSVTRLEASAVGYGDARITAVVTNLSKRELQSVQVAFDLFEPDGVRARSTSPDVVTDLTPGQAARVRSQYYEHENIDSVAVGDVEVEVAPAVAP